MFLFFSIAFLSGSLADRLQRAGARLERASTEIADLQAFNQHVIDSLASGLATTDRQGRILTFNRAAEVITGQPAASVVGRRLEDVLELPPNVVERSDGGAADRRAAAASRRRTGRATAGRSSSGSPRPQLQTPGGNAGLLFAFQDVTDIKKLERDARLRQRLAAVGEMAAGIAHEIRNPLASMSGSIQILRQELPLTDEQAQLMDIVLRESERLNDTIRSFLAYARPQRFSIARLDVRRVLNDAALLLRNSSEVLEGHVIEVEVPPTEVAFEADENQIRQIVWNLATNGLRAMRNGGRLTLGARLSRARTSGEICRARRVGRRRGHSRRGARRDLSAVPRHVLEGHRPRPRDRAPHRQRLRRRDPGQLDARAAGTTVSVRLPVRAVAAAATTKT